MLYNACNLRSDCPNVSNAMVMNGNGNGNSNGNENGKCNARSCNAM